MPDFERLHRSLALHRANDEQRPIIAAYYRGLDVARWQVVRIAAAVATITIVSAWIIGR